MTEKPKPTDKALRIRRMIKSKKPEFVRYESWRYVRLGKSWRKQIGLDNKARLKMKGWEVSPRIGFRGPREARGLHPSGYKERLVYNLKNLDKLDPKEYAIKISHQVGTRKRMLILGKAEELGLKVLNPVAEVTLPPSETEITKEKETKKISKEKEEGKELEKEKEKREARKEPEKKQEKKPQKGKEKREPEKKQKRESKAPPKRSSKVEEKGKRDESKTKKKGR